jgi:hypothetical protein
MYLCVLVFVDVLILEKSGLKWSEIPLRWEMLLEYLYIPLYETSPLLEIFVQKEKNYIYTFIHLQPHNPFLPNPNPIPLIISPYPFYNPNPISSTLSPYLTGDIVKWLVYDTLSP